MKLGYMTNGFGKLVADGNGVTNMKDVHYVTLGDTKEMIRKIAETGYEAIEMFDGNLLQIADDVDNFNEFLKSLRVDLLGIYIGCFFIYEDALEEELEKIKSVCIVAKKLGVKHIVLGGGSVRQNGIQDSDYTKICSALEKANEIVKSYGMIASYHPHLGSIAENACQIDTVLENTDIAFCPDIAHLVAGGANALELIQKYHDRIHYVHLKDLSASGEFVPLGTGIIDLESIIKYLKSIGYDGDWLVEIDGYSGDPSEACEISYQYLNDKL